MWEDYWLLGKTGKIILVFVTNEKIIIFLTVINNYLLIIVKNGKIIGSLKWENYYLSARIIAPNLENSADSDTARSARWINFL